MDRLSTIIKIILFILLIGSLWYALGDNIVKYIKDSIAKRKRLQQFSVSNKGKRRSGFSKIIKFRAIAGFESENIIVFSIIIFVFSLILISFLINFSLSTILSSGAIAMLPIALKRIKLEEMRIKGSYDGKEIVSLILNNYHICNRKMILALNKTAIELKTDYSRNVFSELAREVKTYKSTEELSEIVDNMNYAYNTTWSKLLSYAIIYSVENSEDVTEVLEDILSYFKRLNESAEVHKRYNSETNKLLQFFVPISYVALMWYGSSIYGYTLFELLQKQFTVPANLQLFIYIVIGYIICIVLAKLINQPKYDL